MNQTLKNPLHYIETAQIEYAPVSTLESDGGPQLDTLPAGIVAGTTLVDFSGTASPEIRSAVTLAMIFASRVATKQVGKEKPQDEWLAAYQTSLSELGFSVSGMALQRASFSKKGLQVHKAIIPFLTIAMGGAGVGPIILAALKHLGEVNDNRPWLTLYDRETRRLESSELHFAAVTSDSATTTIRHVVARLAYTNKMTNVLFFKIDAVTAEFESATTTITGNNLLLSATASALLEKMKGSVGSYIADLDDDI